MNLVKKLPLPQLRHLSIVPVLLLANILILFSCKKTDQHQPPPQPTQFFITEMVDTGSYIGMVINDPYVNKQFAAFGKKDKDGNMDTIIHILVRFPDSGEWLSHEFDENFEPTQTTTSTGQTIDYTNIDEGANTFSVDIKETNSGTVLWHQDNLPLPDYYKESQDQAENIANSGGTRQRNKKAELIYLGSQIASCVIGVAGVTMGGPVGTALAIFSAAQSCQSAASTLNNMLNNKPAFGCASAVTHAKAFNKMTKAALYGTSVVDIAKKGLPGAIGYLAQMAGQEGCDKNSEDPPQDPDGSGSSWGDPHLSTLDGFIYDFHGFGEFIAAKSLTDNFEVQVRLGNPYSTNPHTTYNIGIAVQTGNDRVCFLAGSAQLFINGDSRDLDFNTLVLQGGGSITRQGSGNKQELIIKHKHGDITRLRITSSTYFDYSVQLTADRKGKMEGLLGNYDGVELNDLKLRNGEPVEKKFSALYPKFADSWRITNANSLFWYPASQSTANYTRVDLPKAPVLINYDQYQAAAIVCNTAGVRSEPYLSACIIDVATSGDPAVAASSYAQQEENSVPKYPALDLTGIGLKGDAQYIDSSIRLTRNTPYVAGQAFRTNALHGDFETTFAFRIALSQNGGSDGLAFIIAKDIPPSVSNAYPGLSGKIGYEGVPSSLAVEFDTRIDNHVAIHTNGTGPNSTDNAFRIGHNSDIIPLEDGMFHSARVVYKVNKLQVWLDGILVLEKEIDLKQTLGLANTFYIGLTASTSSSSQAHFIHSWEVSE